MKSFLSKTFLHGDSIHQAVRALAFAAVTSTGLLGSFQTVNAQDLTVLVDPNPVELPADIIDANSGNVAELVNWVYSIAADRGVKLALRNALDSELENAWRTGQKGVLVRTEYYSIEIDGVNHYVFEPVVVIGQGPSAEAVCFVKSCQVRLSASRPPVGSRLVGDVSYTWVEFDDPAASRAKPVPKTFKMSRYSTALEAAAAHDELDAKLNLALRSLIQQQRLSSYATALVQNLPSKDDRAVVTKLIASRDKALADRKEIETQLQEQLRRAEKAARTSALFSTLGQVFQLGQAVSLATNMMGSNGFPPSPTTPLNSNEDVIGALNAINAQATKAAVDLTTRSSAQTQVIIQIDTKIIDIGTKKLPAPAFNFKPNL
jgi:hypothetical protein